VRLVFGNRVARINFLSKELDFFDYLPHVFLAGSLRELKIKKTLVKSDSRKLIPAKKILMFYGRLPDTVVSPKVYVPLESFFCLFEI
jgi:hypothetical protein